LPIVATDVGDVRKMLEETKAGIVLRDFSNSAYRAAADELALVLGDPTRVERCTATAQARLSLRRVGLPRYDALYRSVAVRQIGNSAFK
jgi:glycosyltransferase involved in cell wall biosynthesis